MFSVQSVQLSKFLIRQIGQNLPQYRSRQDLSYSFIHSFFYITNIHYKLNLLGAIYTLHQVQADLGDSVGSVPDDFNKASFSIE